VVNEECYATRRHNVNGLHKAVHPIGTDFYWLVFYPLILPWYQSTLIWNTRKDTHLSCNSWNFT
jgi:hypothetical protein